MGYVAVDMKTGIVFDVVVNVIDVLRSHLFMNYGL